MPDQNNKGGGLLDTVESVTGAALALGAGAALLYRTGGSSALSGGLRNASRAINETMNTVSGSALKDIDANFISGVARDFKTNMSRTNDDLTLNTNSSRNVLNVLASAFQMNRNKEGMLMNRFEQEQVLYPLKYSLQENFGKGNSVLNRKTEDLVDDAFKNFNKSVRYQDQNLNYIFNDDFIKKHFGDNSFSQVEQNKMLQQINTTLLNKKNGSAAFVREHMGSMDNIISEALNISSLSKKFGSSGNISTGESIKDTALGDATATLNDILRNKEKIKGQVFARTPGNNFSTSEVDTVIDEDFLSFVEGLVGKDAAYGDLKVNGIRIDKEGGLKSFTEAAQTMDKLANSFANTLPGKLFKARDIYGARTADNIYFTNKGQANPLLAHVAEGRGSTLTGSPYVRVMDKTFRINDDNSLEHIKELDDYYLMSGEHGTGPRQLKSMVGDIDRSSKRHSDTFLGRMAERLDFKIGTISSHMEGAAAFGKKFEDPRWGRNIMNSLLDADTGMLVSMAEQFQRNSYKEEFGPMAAAAQEAEQYLAAHYKSMKDANKIFNQTTKQLSRSTANKLKNASGDNGDLFEMLTMENQDMMDTLLSRTGAFVNEDLGLLAKRYRTNPKEALDSISLVSNNMSVGGSTRGVAFYEKIRKEIAKEAMLVYSEKNGKGGLLRLFDRAGISGQELKETKYLSNWADFQKASGIRTNNEKPRAVEDMISPMMKAQELFSGRIADDVYNSDRGFLSSFQENIRTMASEKNSVFQKGFKDNKDILPGHNFGKYTYMRKSISALDVINNINDITKWKSFGKQFVAGRQDMGNITTATLFPYFAINRLIDPLASLGLGFSPKSMGSVGDLASSVMFKRIMPIAGAITAFNYLDFESENLTGTSISGAFANTRANMDLSRRRLADNMGLGGVFKTENQLNPMMRYWNDQGSYQNYEERKQWYQDGYSPVRKSRWWSFGSASEFRGTKVDYYKPNFLRDAHSDAKDIGIYGSEDEKWKHSWIPTPRHPLSPIRALLEPYWLEEKHYWDRPYPVTGKMFEEGSPWGGILNPTIGQILKPMKRMHQNELGSSLVDVRSLIESRNNELRDKAGRNSDLIRLEGDKFVPVTYTPLGAPTQEQRVANVVTAKAMKMAAEAAGLGTSGGEIAAYAGTGPNPLGDGGIGSASGPMITGSEMEAMSLSQYEPMHDRIQARAMGFGDYGVAAPTGLAMTKKIQISADRGGVTSGLIAGALPLDMINSMNRETMQRAKYIAPKGGDYGVVVNDAITRGTINSEDPLNGIDAADLRNTSSTKEFLQDAGYSAKELGGMYGYMLQEAFPNKGQHRLQSADRMESFNRGFWDSSIGGLGGDFMEIGRRFIPHEDHSIERINPIRNTMPEWMPGRFKFGDPYESLPNGETRLPGAGYEDMYKLHTDQYGRYGAFDRMKVLADVAPWSNEYKTWKRIAQKTISDPVLEAEMKQIKNRVEEQSKAHDFFSYNFKDAKLTETTAVVDDVKETWFSIVGSDKQYKMAGIKMAEGKYLSDFLTPGTSIRMRYGQNEEEAKKIRAIVMVDNINLNKKMLKSKDAEVSADQSAAGVQARFTASQISRGAVLESIAHAPIPFLHNKFMRINTPIESFKDEQIYGTSYATWSHPIQGFIIPSFQKAFNVSGTNMLLGTAAWLAAEVAEHKTNASKTVQIATRTLFTFTNPGAFAGSMIGFITDLHGTHIKNGGRIGAAIGTAGYLATNASNPFFSVGSGAALGSMIGEQLWKGTGAKGAAVGAAVGLAASALKNPEWDPEKMFGPGIPDRIKKKWEIEEYYDRLRYVKYMGLYEKASRIAKRKENVDVVRIVNKFEYDADKREKIKEELLANRELISNTYSVGDARRDALLMEVNQKIGALAYPQQILKAGEYTKSALAYKQAAESTIYGMKDNATWAQILRAVPKYERDYVLEFAKESDSKKREEILSYMSPYRRKVMQVLWGQEVDKVKESNADFFASHKLPGVFWAGWQPGVDLDHVEIKTIKNEGMLLSDFGFYDSQSNTPDAQAAPSVDYTEGTTSLINLQKNLTAALKGAGLLGVDVSIQPSQEPGIQMVANIARIADYQVQQKINGMFGKTFY